MSVVDRLDSVGLRASGDFGFAGRSHGPQRDPTMVRPAPQSTRCRTAPRRSTVQFDEFIEAVAERADTSRGEAQALVRATLRTLAERISGGEAEDLRAQLPRELKGDLISPEENAQGFDVDEFVRRVAERTGLDETDAGARVAAVLSVLRDAVSPGAFDDVIGQLGREFAELIEAADRRGIPAN